MHKFNYLIAMAFAFQSLHAFANDAPIAPTYNSYIAGDNNNILDYTMTVVIGNNNYNFESPYTISKGNNNASPDPMNALSHATDSAVLIGNGNTLKTGEYNIVVGNNNTFIDSRVPADLSAADRSINNIAVGSNNKVSDAEKVVVIGNKNTASDNNSIAIGSGSSASRADEMNVGDRQITGVKAGVNGTDAVNVTQLNESATQTEQNANHYTDDQFYEAKNTANQYTDQRIFELLNNSNLDFAKSYANDRFYQLNKRLEQTRNLVNAGVASAIASAAIPQKLGKQLSFGMGVGSYKNQMAGAIGIKYGLTRYTAIATTLATNTKKDTSIYFSIAYGF